MHVVIWTSQGQRYATPSATVVEVIPVVQSRPIPGSESWLTGLFDYRGELLPLIDSSRLLVEQESNVRLSSRILVIRVERESSTGETPRGQQRVGLIVEHVLGAEQIEFADEAAHPPTPRLEFEFLGPVALQSNGTIQLILSAGLPTLKTEV